MGVINKVTLSALQLFFTFLCFIDMVFDACNVCRQVDAVRNQCNKNIQSLMEEMHFLEMVSVKCSLFPSGGRSLLKAFVKAFALVGCSLGS